MDIRSAVLMLVVLANAHEVPPGVYSRRDNNVDVIDDGSLNDTELVLAFVVFRHGDRTPDEDEIAKMPNMKLDKKQFFPYGFKELTNKGKQRLFKVGEYLRQRYDGFISRFYLPDEIKVRTTDYARTKMSALLVMAAMYKPMPAQKWNPALDWQPIPYTTIPASEDDMMFWHNCPRYSTMLNKIYSTDSMREQIRRGENLLSILTDLSGANITTPNDVFYLDNLLQTLTNSGIEIPAWATDLMPEIKKMTKLEYTSNFFNDDAIKLTGGVLLNDVIKASNNAIAGITDQPKLQVYSAHENNVAALMAASRVFIPHQPNYGATFSLELRRHRRTGRYGIAAVYKPDIFTPTQIFSIPGCGGKILCDYESFLSLTHDLTLTREEYKKYCQI